jgi:hydroxymethylcytosylglucuronate/cytosylglucuronate synthase
MPDREKPVLLASACDFGWGSLGKLRLVLEELPGVAIALDTASSLSPTVRSMLGDRHSFTECKPEAACAGLVINDPRAADELTDCGLPVIYLDSLPYLWTTREEIPRSVAIYCAQKSPADLPAGSPLANRRDVTWIDPVVPRSRRRLGGSGIVINVGGLHSHLSGDSTNAYVRLALMPLARLLADASYPVTAVCGNLPQWAVHALSALFPGQTKIGPQTPRNFERTLAAADTLITSPGSTTLLQAAAIGLRTSLLPPQNLSQILNAELFSAPSTPNRAWPSSVIDRAKVDSLRPAGEDIVLEYIYGQIIHAAKDKATEAAMTARFAAVLSEIAAGSDAPANVTALGFNGASQVARFVRQATLAPLPRAQNAIRDRAGSDDR